MSSFPLISDEHLLQALIRKLQVRNATSDDRVTPEGAHFDSLLATSVGSTLFEQEEFDTLIRVLVEDKTLTLAGRLSFHDGEEQKIKDSMHGIIATLHPEASVLEHQFFTENWTPIIARRSNDTGRRLYPNDNMSFHRLKISMVYVTADGLPPAFADLPVIYPVT